MAIAIGLAVEPLSLIDPPLDVFSLDEQPTAITNSAPNKNDRYIACSFLKWPLCFEFEADISATEPCNIKPCGNRFPQNAQKVATSSGVAGHASACPSLVHPAC